MFVEVNSVESNFLKKNFSAYYEKNFVDSVPSVELREFGFGVFKRKIANRNLAFGSLNELNNFLRTSAPLFFSYSNSYYAFPARTPMIKKEWIKSDLIYEFDADELGVSVEEINGVQWFTSTHLNEAKRQVYRLVELLENEFGFPSSEVKINFSGKAGYHVHFRGESIHHLNKRSRIELVDYLTGFDFDYANHGFFFDTYSSPKPSAIRGARGKRIINGVKKVFLEEDADFVSTALGFSKKKALTILKKKEFVLDSLEKGLLFPLEEKKKSGLWKKLLDRVLQKEVIPIDRQTSVDLHKIIRVPSTLHGETGFLAKEISLDELKDFDSFYHPIVFGSTPTKIRVNSTPKFWLRGEEFGPYNEEIVEVPLFAAIYLVGRGCALLP